MSDNTKIAQRELQIAVNAKLIAAPAISVSVYDEVPAGTAMPYAVFGDIPPDSAFEARGVKGRSAPLTMKVYCRGSGGKLEALAVADEIVAKLTGATLTLTSFNHVSVTFLSSSAVRDEEDTDVYVATVQFLYKLAKKT